MFLNSLHVRIGLIISGILVMGLFFAMGGSFEQKPVIQIEFGMWPQELEGLEVSIDGKVVGTLKRFGNSFRTGFAVKEGKHTVELNHPEIACIPARVTSGAGGRTVLLTVDFVEFYEDGKVDTRIQLMP